jgi:ribonuclease HI
MQRKKVQKDKSALLKDFFQDLSKTLDLKSTMKKLSIDEAEAGKLLRLAGELLSKRAESAKHAAKLTIKPTPKPKRSPKSNPELDFDSSVKESSLPSKISEDTSTLVIHVDGASRGNPGKAGAGALIEDDAGRVLKKSRRYLGVVTNNVAEYEALILALEDAMEISSSAHVKVFADSELMVKQMRGEYKVRNEGLRGLYVIAKKLARTFKSFEIKHVLRAKNKAADKLANEAIDKLSG